MNSCSTLTTAFTTHQRFDHSPIATRRIQGVHPTPDKTTACVGACPGSGERCSSPLVRTSTNIPQILHVLRAPAPSGRKPSAGPPNHPIWEDRSNGPVATNLTFAEQVVAPPLPHPSYSFPSNASVHLPGRRRKFPYVPTVPKVQQNGRRREWFIPKSSTDPTMTSSLRLTRVLPALSKVWRGFEDGGMHRRRAHIVPYSETEIIEKTRKGDNSNSSSFDGCM